jgi:hypothetical protein
VAAAMAEALVTLACLPDTRADVERALFEHDVPSRDAYGSGKLEYYEVEPFPLIDRADAIWNHLRPGDLYAWPCDEGFFVTLSYHVYWDVEHTLDAEFFEGKFGNLCGSVAVP